MTTLGTGNLNLSHGYEVLQPKSGTAYPVPCDEWKFLKDKLKACGSPPWILRAAAFMFWGASLTLLITILRGGVAPGDQGQGVVIAWIFVWATGACGAAFFYLAVRQSRMEQTLVSDVITHMELIEDRFEAGAK
jgi:hypothetical protein